MRTTVRFNFKKAIAVFLSVVMVVTLLPLTAFAAITTTLSVNVGKETGNYNPFNNNSFSVSSSDPSIATTSKAGKFFKIQGKAAGTATITATMSGQEDRVYVVTATKETLPTNSFDLAEGSFVKRSCSGPEIFTSVSFTNTIGLEVTISDNKKDLYFTAGVGGGTGKVTVTAETTTKIYTYSVTVKAKSVNHVFIEYLGVVNTDSIPYQATVTDGVQIKINDGPFLNANGKGVDGFIFNRTLTLYDTVTIKGTLSALVGGVETLTPFVKTYSGAEIIAAYADCEYGNGLDFIINYTSTLAPVETTTTAAETTAAVTTVAETTAAETTAAETTAAETTAAETTAAETTAAETTAVETTAAETTAAETTAAETTAAITTVAETTAAETTATEETAIGTPAPTYSISVTIIPSETTAEEIEITEETEPAAEAPETTPKETTTTEIEEIVIDDDNSAAAENPSTGNELSMTVTGIAVLSALAAAACVFGGKKKKAQK